MKASQIVKPLTVALRLNMPVLVLGTPGVGKSDVLKQTVGILQWDLLILHGVVKDPTDFTGLPATGNMKLKDGSTKLVADFIPYGDLLQMIEADKPLVVFFDDLGQAPVSVQAAIMQIILERQINGKKISPHVRFIAASNFKKDGAGVSGLITPLISRFGLIVEMEVDAGDWIDWAIKADMPLELIAYIRHAPKELNGFDPAKSGKDMKPFAVPRTIAFLGEWMKAGVFDLDVWCGVVGPGFAPAFHAFWKIASSLGNLPDEILAAPKKARVPVEKDVLNFVIVALSVRANAKTFPKILLWAARLDNREFLAFLIKLCVNRDKEIQETDEFRDWALNNTDIIL